MSLQPAPELAWLLLEVWLQLPGRYRLGRDPGQGQTPQAPSAGQRLLDRRLLRRPRSSARHVQHQELRGLRRATKASWCGTGRCSACSLRGCG